MIPYGRHCIEEDDIDSVVSVLKSDWLTTGPTICEFEDALASRTNAYALACSNGTVALHLAMLGLHIQAGDVVFVPAITFLASANAVRYVGANVFFVDINPATGLMHADDLEEAILMHAKHPIGQPRAVVNVHLSGQCSELEAIMRVAHKYQLYIIEDAAHAMGTVFISQDGSEHAIGSCDFCDVTTFSFHPVKTITMGEGGAVTVKDKSLFQRMLLYRNHSMNRNIQLWHGSLLEKGPWYYEEDDLGYNYRVSDIQAALGVSQMRKLDRFINERARLVSVYDEYFNNTIIHPLIRMQCSRTSWHLYIVLIDFQSICLTRSLVMQHLENVGIGSQVHYIPLYYQPYYQALYGLRTLPGAELYYKKCLSIPLYVGLKDDQQAHVIHTLKNILHI